MRLVRAAFVASMILAASELSAQTNGGASTRDGVYTREQSMRGQDVYAGNCKSCHTPESHTGELFTSKWNGKSLLELYTYLRESMPKNDPGTLSTEEYADVMAYMLRMNKMPQGDNDLPTDTATLKAIRIHIKP